MGIVIAGVSFGDWLAVTCLPRVYRSSGYEDGMLVLVNDDGFLFVVNIHEVRLGHCGCLCMLWRLNSVGFSVLRVSG